MRDAGIRLLTTSMTSIASAFNSHSTILYRQNGLQARPYGFQKQQQSSARPCQTTTPPLLRRLFRFSQRHPLRRMSIRLSQHHLAPSNLHVTSTATHQRTTSTSPSLSMPKMRSSSRKSSADTLRNTRRLPSCPYSTSANANTASAASAS